jgi:hypothetical protein
MHQPTQNVQQPTHPPPDTLLYTTHMQASMQGQSVVPLHLQLKAAVGTPSLPCCCANPPYVQPMLCKTAAAEDRSFHSSICNTRICATHAYATCGPTSKSTRANSALHSWLVECSCWVQGNMLCSQQQKLLSAAHNCPAADSQQHNRESKACKLPRTAKQRDAHKQCPAHKKTASCTSSTKCHFMQGTQHTPLSCNTPAAVPVAMTCSA